MSKKKKKVLLQKIQINVFLESGEIVSRLHLWSVAPELNFPSRGAQIVGSLFCRGEINKVKD